MYIWIMLKYVTQIENQTGRIFHVMKPRDIYKYEIGTSLLFHILRESK